MNIVTTDWTSLLPISFIILFCIFPPQNDLQAGEESEISPACHDYLLSGLLIEPDIYHVDVIRIRRSS